MYNTMKLLQASQFYCVLHRRIQARCIEGLEVESEVLVDFIILVGVLGLASEHGLRFTTVGCNGGNRRCGGINPLYGTVHGQLHDDNQDHEYDNGND